MEPTSYRDNTESTIKRGESHQHTHESRKQFNPSAVHVETKGLKRRLGSRNIKSIFIIWSILCRLEKEQKHAHTAFLCPASSMQEGW